MTDESKRTAEIAAATTIETYVVHGRVSSADRAGVGGLRVEVVDKNVGAHVSLGQGATDASGNYSLQFSSVQVTSREKAAPDIQVRVFAGHTLLVASQVRYNAGVNETIDVRLPASASAALPSEHETLTSTLAGHFKGNLRDLKEDANQQDITFLANKSGWDARAVALAALADQFSQATQSSAGTATGPAIQPAFFYALFRAGLPANPDTLYRASVDTVAGTWKQAIAQGVVPKTLESEMPRAQQAFQALSAQHLLTGKAAAGVSSLKDMLAVSRLSEAQQQQFATLYSANRNDPDHLWKAVGDAFGKDVANRLQVDGKLGFLTINNAPLMRQLQKLAGATGLSDPVQLAQAGYHRSAKWVELLGATVPVPQEIPGDSPETKKANYAAFLAAQVRLSYPTAAVAEMVKSGDLKVKATDDVIKFLTAHQGQFEIGMQPVQQYLAKNKLALPETTIAEVKKLQRVYQMTTSDQAMGALLRNELDAAYHIVRLDKEAFVQKLTQDIGSAQEAGRVYDKAVQLHHAVLNIAISYLTASSGLQLGAAPLPAGQTAAVARAMAKGTSGSGLVLDPAPTGPTPENAADVIAYPTLETLFGSMDFCACAECRSVLSPAAYLVDLLQFIDQEPTPAEKAAGKLNPQTVLLSRRPDLQHLPLTCENTNTALPYIDVVNETLEYYVANGIQPLSLQHFQGHDTNGSASEDLLASPQFVMDAAYTILGGERFPSQLPFHQPLENLRRYFQQFSVPLSLSMERLRKSDDLERGGNPYGWRDILAEEIGLSRDEYDLLTDGALPLKQIYGFASLKSDDQVVSELANAKEFSRRAEISYEDVVALLGTQFINSNSNLIPKLSKLGVNIAMLVELKTKNDAATDLKFEALLPQGAATLDPAEYGGDIKKWVKDPNNFDRIMGLITLTDPSANPDPCDFDQLEFRFAKPMTGAGDTSTRLGTVEFVRMLRFIRLWKKIGWTIEQTDAAICALYNGDLTPITVGNLDAVDKLDAGFKILLPRLGIIKRAMNLLGLTAKRELLPLLACWSDIGIHGDTALYRQMFLNPAVSQRDPDFADNGFGEFLKNNKKLTDYAETLRAAFSLTGDEFDRILAALNFDGTTPLTLANISAVYRRGWFAHRMRLSVRELLLLTSLTGLDPFAAPDLPSAGNPAILHIVTLVQAMKARSLKSAATLYLIWNQDLSGKSAPTDAQVTEFARSLRGDFAAIEDQFAATEDPGGDVARARMTLVYGQEASDSFFALLDNTLVLDVAYSHGQPTLQPAITAVDANLAYDDFRHRLSQTGLLSGATQGALEVLPVATAAFKKAVDDLFARSQDALGSFFARYPELKPLYDAYVASVEPVEVKRSRLLAAFRPGLSRLRKQQQALQRLSAAAVIDLPSTQVLVNAAGAPYPLHAAGHTDQPALNDVLALETPGLAAQFFFRDTATGAVDQRDPDAANLDYAAPANPLPANSAPGAAISGIWTGLVETPEAGFYNIVIETDAGAGVSLSLDGQTRALVQNGTLWRNNDSIELQAGKLYGIVLKVEKVKDTLSVKWETPKRAREVFPGRYLYPPTIIAPFRDVYVRFLKATSLAAGLLITANELVRFATDTDYQVAGDGWLNALPVDGDPSPAAAAALLQPFEALLGFAEIKAAVSSADEQLLTALLDPVAATATADSLMFSLLRWDKTSLNDLLNQFGSTIAGLTHFDLFRRVYDAFTPVQTMGIAAAALTKSTTNDPAGNTVRDLQSALRARYDTASWRDIIQPINNDMRGLQRDALVAYVLHQMREDPASEQIDTADKLFEYFLMDVQMEPCMQTSRIRHALSSVQLFIERCFMNLEPHATLSSTQAARWQWMKRYRVWEANRKVFLFPENWLEPELRDDKSPIFKEIESQLLQSDITDDAATTALLNYLTKLEEVAKLEPCGIYHLEGDPQQGKGDVDHVIARTAGAHRKYYYRRYEFGYWTPWEEIKLEIEDNPVIPVVWQGRLLLFWLKIMKQTPLAVPDSPASPSPGEPTLGGLHMSEVKQDAKRNAAATAQVIVQAVLCWSEYYNAKWQAAKTSDVNRATTLGQYDPTGPYAFDRTQLTLTSYEGTDVLRLLIGGEGFSRFDLYNTHSLPVREEDDLTLFSPRFFPKTGRFPSAVNDVLEIDYWASTGPDSETDLNRDVLKVTNGVPLSLTVPQQDLHNPWDAPFFVEDSRHVFYVTTTEQPVWIPNYNDYGAVMGSMVAAARRLPPLVLAAEQAAPVGQRFVGDGGPQGPDVMNAGTVQRFVTQDAYIRQGLGGTGKVQFGGVQIGPSGAISNTKS